MKNKCSGSGQEPQYLDTREPGFGSCPGCPSMRRLRADGKMRAHQPSPNYNHLVRELLKGVMK